MNREWPEIRPSQVRLGSGVVLDAQVLKALRLRDAPAHERICRRVIFLAEARLPFVASLVSVYAAASWIESDFGAQAATAMLLETLEIFHVIPPTGEDLAGATRILNEGIELTLEQAIAGVLARRLDCSIYGLVPGYHMLQIPVVLD